MLYNTNIVSTQLYSDTLSAALVMQGQAAYGASLKKTGETIQEATSEITAAEGEAAVPGDDEADDSNDGNEKDEQEALVHRFINN